MKPQSRAEVWFPAASQSWGRLCCSSHCGACLKAACCPLTLVSRSDTFEGSLCCSIQLRAVEDPCFPHRCCDVVSQLSLALTSEPGDDHSRGAVFQGTGRVCAPLLGISALRVVTEPSVGRESPWIKRNGHGEHVPVIKSDSYVEEVAPSPQPGCSHSALPQGLSLMPGQLSGKAQGALCPLPLRGCVLQWVGSCPASEHSR